MNFLQLCQRTMQECGVSGTLTTVAGQVGSLQRIVSWVGTAWEEIQTKHDDWEWMKSSVLLGGGASFTTVALQGSYPLGTGAGTCGILAANFGKWDRYSMRNYNTVAGVSGEIFMDPISFESWRDSYMYGAQRLVQSRPVAAAIGSDKSICLGPMPAAGYTINADYWLAPSAMSIDADVPTGLPAQFHMAIVWSACIMYGYYESASEVIQKGEMYYGKLMSELEATYAPEVSSGETLC